MIIIFGILFAKYRLHFMAIKQYYTIILYILDNNYNKKSEKVTRFALKYR